MAQRIRTLITLPENPSLIIRTYMAAPQLSATAILEVIQHPCLTLVGKRHTYSTYKYIQYIYHKKGMLMCTCNISIEEEDLELHASKDYTTLKKKERRSEPQET